MLQNRVLSLKVLVTGIENIENGKKIYLNFK